MSVTIKQGDIHDTEWVVNMDLTGATVRLLCRPLPKQGLPNEVTVLASTITDAPGGVITHRTTGTLAIGNYAIEAEVTRAGEIVTFPNAGYETLRVVADLD